MIRLNIIFLAVICSIGAAAYEVDNFTHRYEPLPDAMEVLDAEMNRKLKKVEEVVSSEKCVERNLVYTAKDVMDGWIVYGSVERFAEKADAIKRHKPDGYSIYGFFHSGFMVKIGRLHSSVNVNGTYVGTDKFGHFLDEGAMYYDMIHGPPGKTMQEVLEAGEKLEHGLYGYGTTNIKSYGDLAANYEGYRFWSSLVKGENPYFRCVDGHWKQVRKFTFADYVNSAWDEGINCSTYLSPQLAEQVRFSTGTLEMEALRDQKRRLHYHCPISKTECEKLAKRYKEVAKHILSPLCLDAKGDDEDPKQISGQRRGSKGVPSGVSAEENQSVRKSQ